MEICDPDLPRSLSLTMEESQPTESAPGENIHSERDTEGRQDDPDATGSN